MLRTMPNRLINEFQVAHMVLKKWITHKCIALSASTLAPNITMWMTKTVSQCKELKKRDGNGEREDTLTTLFIGSDRLM